MKRERINLTNDQKNMLLQYEENTFTIEFSNSNPVRNGLIEKGLIERHPDGPFGSRCSYYRTQKGMDVWKILKGT